MFKKNIIISCLICLISGVIEKDMFSLISILINLIFFVTTDEVLRVLFDLKVSDQIELGSNGQAEIQKTVDVVRLKQLRVVLWIIVINLMFVLVLMDRLHLGLIILELIKNTISVTNGLLVSMLYFLMTGIIKYISIRILLLLEDFMYRKYQKKITDFLTKGTHFF